jgi:hypothetical protein
VSDPIPWPSASRNGEPGREEEEVNTESVVKNWTEHRQIPGTPRVAGCLKSSIVSELPIEFRAFDGRHHVSVCDKDAGFKQAIPLIRCLLLIAVGH